MSVPVSVQRFGSARAAACGAVAFALAGALLVALAPGRSGAWQPLLGLAIGFPMLVAFGAAIVDGRERGAWIAIAAGMTLTVAAGKLGMPGGQSVPAKAWSLGDLLWAVRFPVLYGGVAIIVARRSPAFGVRQVLDGLVGAFAAAALMELLVVPWMAAGAHADATTVALHSRFPVLDMAVVGFLVGAAALNAWPVRTWLPLAADMALFLVCQVVDARAGLAHPAEAMSWATYPGYLAAGWLIASVVYALRAQAGRLAVRRRPMAPSLLLAGGAVATLVAVSGATDASWLARGLAAASLVAALLRQALMLRDNDRLLAITEAEASTDALTGLGNRRLLAADLEAAAAAGTEASPQNLALFDLDGFKLYNDTFGHPAGDALLQRLGAQLAEAVRPHRAYRMGGDEFCVLVPGQVEARAVVRDAHAALRERGEGFSITASCGTASLPGDARDPSDALRIADQRMYAQKERHRRPAPPAAAPAALLQLVRERDPALGAHTSEVSAWADAVARTLGARPVIVEQARLGGELHDIGKTSVPDAILTKPGPLTDHEWEFMRRHTLIGERILLADGALGHVAPVARSHHERWDGSGYPDGLSGREIPLAARIVAVCDAYQAMVADRPYRRGRSHTAAVAELLKCRGTQFDPAVVDAFLAVIQSAPARAAA